MNATLSIAAFAVLLIFVGLWLARRMGRTEAERDIAEEEAEHARKRREIDEDVRRLSDAELDAELERLRRH